LFLRRIAYPIKSLLPLIVRRLLEKGVNKEDINARIPVLPEAYASNAHIPFSENCGVGKRFIPPRSATILLSAGMLLLNAYPQIFSA